MTTILLLSSLLFGGEVVAVATPKVQEPTKYFMSGWWTKPIPVYTIPAGGL